MIWIKLTFGGFGRRGIEVLVAFGILATVIAIVGSSLMVIQGARDALTRTEQQDRPDIIQVKSRFNRALFETPRSGNLPPLTLPVYEPLLDPAVLAAAVGNNQIIERRSFLRNVVSGDTFLNIYIFGIDPNREPQVSTFAMARGRFLQSDDRGVAILDRATAQALGVDLGGTFPVRKADGNDLQLPVIGILDELELREAPPRTVETPTLKPDSNLVSGGALVSLSTSGDIFGRPSLTDALVVARTAADVPNLVDNVQEAFRLEPGVFVSERYSQFRRKVHDFVFTLTLFSLVSLVTVLLAGAFVAALLHDVFTDRRRQLATLIALGFQPMSSLMPDVALGVATALTGIVIGCFVAIALAPRHFAMPSLMANLGAIEPRMSWAVGSTTIVIAFAAVALGVLPTVIRAMRRPQAATLSDSA